MSMFPGYGAEVYYNEAGEPLGWDMPSYDPPEPDDPFEDDRIADEQRDAFEEQLADEHEGGGHADAPNPECWQCDEVTV